MKGWNPMAKKNLLKVIVAICAVCLSIVVMAPLQGTAHAATSSANVCTLQSTPAGIYEKEVDEVGSYGPSTLTMSQTTSVSNSVSGEVGFTVQAISAKLGVNVTQSNGVTLSDVVAVPDGQFAKIVAWGVFNETFLQNSCGGSAVVYVYDHVYYQTLWNQNT